MDMRTYDNTKLSTHRDCPRKFYYRHIRNWVRTGPPSIAPGFGIAMHAGMDAIWRGVCYDRSKDPIEVAQAGYTAFEQSWLEQGFLPADCDDEDKWFPYKFRRPDIAADIILEYVKHNWRFLSTAKLLEVGIEVPFLAPIDPDDPSIMYMGRMDKVLEIAGKIWILDHKTTARYRKDGGFSPEFLDGFSPDHQIDGYGYHAYQKYGKLFAGVLIDGILVHKTVRRFCQIPVQRDIRQMSSWVWEARREIQNIERDLKGLEGPNAKASDYLMAFPKNTHSCFDFGSRCSYLDLCKMFSNPHAETMPLGFEENEWNPVYADQLETKDE